MCRLLFEYDVRLSVKLYFTKSYMNIRTIIRASASAGALFFIYLFKLIFFVSEVKLYENRL